MTMTITEENSLFERSDFTNIMAYTKYRNGERLYDYDFTSKEKYIAWFILDLEMANWAVIIVDGFKRSGKSLFCSWLAYWNKKLFGKSATINYRPHICGERQCHPSDFGNYNFLNQQIFVEEWVKLTEVAEREDANEIASVDNMSAMTKYSAFWNSTIVIDEAKKWVWKRLPNTILLRYMAELTDIAGHNHNVMLYACPNAEKVIDDSNILEGRTHVVHCSFNTRYKGYATYQIMHRNSGKVRWLHLSASENSYLWDSENPIGMSALLTRKEIEKIRKRIMENKLETKDESN